MSYTIEWKPSARKEIRKLDPTVRRRIIEAVTALGVEPRPPGSVTLTGSPRWRRIRIGGYRVLYDIRDDALVVLVPHRLSSGVGAVWPGRTLTFDWLSCRMGTRNFLVEGVSGTGKTSVCIELQRRGYHAIHGDRELASQGDPETGEPTDSLAHEHHIWYADKVKALIANQDELVTFFCGGSRNFAKFIDLFDGVFVLEVDIDTLHRRLDERPDSEWGGGKPVERELVARLHQTKEDIPHNGISIDATAPITHVVDEIVRKAKQIASPNAGACRRNQGCNHRQSCLMRSPMTKAPEELGEHSTEVS